MVSSLNQAQKKPKTKYKKKHSICGILRNRIEPLLIYRPMVDFVPCSETTLPTVAVSNEEWQRACKTRAILEEWLKCKTKSRKLAETYARKLQISPATFYRLFKRFSETKQTSSLLQHTAIKKTRKTRLTPEQESMVINAIQKYYLNIYQPTIAYAYKNLAADCYQQGVPEPSITAFRKRINEIPARTACIRRHSKKKADEQFEISKGKFPYADYPLQCIQIDHTQTDTHVVEPETRCVIGRAFLTTAIDCYSRACLGYYVTFAAPSTLSVAMCLAHAVLRKESWLTERGIDAPWNMYGLPEMIHTDNAREFRRKNFARDCQEYGISLQFRPLGKPNFGGTIERWIGTLNSQNHGQPGTTKRSRSSSREYDPQKHACLTLRELDRRFAHFITGQYHNQVHSEIGMPPLAMFEQGVAMMRDKFGKEIREPEDSHRFLLDFLPQVSRRVCDYGIRIDNIEYEGEVLPHLYMSGTKEKFTIRYDPRDISQVYIYVPSDRKYYPLFYKDKTIPQMSKYEYKHIHDEKRRHGKSLEDKDQITASVLAMRDITDQAVKDTKKHKLLRRRNALRPENNPSTVPDQSAPDGTGLPEEFAHSAKKTSDLSQTHVTEEKSKTKRNFEFDAALFETGIDLG